MKINKYCLRRKTWVTADTHFNHKGTKMEGPYATKNFIAKWNKKVSKHDIVIHMGDVIFSRRSELLGIMKQLNGRKILVRGNHDEQKPGWYIGKGFDLCVDQMTCNNVLFTHKPQPWWKLWWKGLINIHGHLHRHKGSHHYGGGTSRHKLVPQRDILTLTDILNS